MLIRHISIPRNSQLICLKQPKQTDEDKQSQDYSHMMNRTLNPQAINKDSPLINMHIDKIKSQSLKKNQNYLRQQSILMERQSPQLYKQYLSNYNISPKKQRTKFQNYQQVKKDTIGLNEIYRNPNFFSNYTPPLSKNAYLMKQALTPIQSQTQINMLNYQQDQQGQMQQQVGLNKHQGKKIKNSELYKTLQRFKAKRFNQGIIENKLPVNKKYSFSLPKHMSSQPQRLHKQSQISEQDARIEKKNFRSKQLIITPTLNSTSNMVQKKKKIMPNEHNLQLQSKTINPINQNDQFLKTQKEPINMSQVLFNKKQAIQTKRTYRPEKVMKYFENTQPSENTFEISYRTSLSRLKQICCTQSIDKYTVTMKIPQIFAYPMFSGNEQQAQLFNKAQDILRNLQIQFKTDIHLKKFTNCITIIVNRIAIIWHFNGKIYFGGWKNQMFDQGCKEGLGLQWSPKKYVYYGEYHKNKRSGIGVMKNNQNQILAGIWRDNHYIRSLLNNEEQPDNKLFSVVK